MESYSKMNDAYGHIKRDSDGAMFCQTLQNPDYVKYLEDIKKGISVKDFDWAKENVRLATSEADKQKVLSDIDKAKGESTLAAIEKRVAFIEKKLGI